MEAIIKAYQQWLRVLNYSSATQKNNPNYLREFFAWLKEQDIDTLEKIQSAHIEGWFTYLCQRKHKKKAAGLSLNYLKSYRTALSQFNRYLTETGKQGFTIPISFKGRSSLEKPVLSQKEIQKLYEASTYVLDPSSENQGILALRERVIMGLFYGCGIRKNEGLQLNVEDVLLKSGLLYIRKGKNYKERYVPIPKQAKEDIRNYLLESRPVLMRKQQHEAFLVGWYGAPMKGSALFDRLQILRQMAGIRKPIGLHTLRHSIATHLLESGMALEQIATFLGHSSLESTQIYTHIRHDS